jgi:hypothetical protein
MNRFALLFAALLCVVAVSCGTSSSLVQRWHDPEFTGKPGERMVIIALAKSERTQKTWEGAFATILREVKVEPIAGSVVLPAQGAADEATLKDAVRATGADLVAVTRLVSVDKEQTYVPGSTYYTPAPAYYGFYGYYASSYAMMSTPGYYQTDKIYSVETNVYDIKTEKLIWSGVTETLNPETGQDAANSIAMTIVDDMIASKVISTKKK